MNELDLQDKYLINFLCERQDGLLYKEAKANTVSPQFFLIEDLRYFLSETTLNKDNYKKLLRKYNSEKELMEAVTNELHERLKSSANMALFINSNKSFTINGISLHLFYPSGSDTYEDKLFDENIFTVIQELPYTFSYKSHDGKNTLSKFSFRPDLSFFLNGIYLGYSELKSNYTNQNARKNGRKKVSKDYLTAVQEYLKIADGNDSSQTIRKEFLKIFEKAIHITSTDVNETYVVRNISIQFDDIKNTVLAQTYDFSNYENKFEKDFKQYPIRNKNASKTERFEEVFRALYDKKMIEKEILYYNFIERELIKKENSKTKEYKHNDGRLISPRPKQKFGTDKIISKIDEFLEHETEPDYFIKKLEAELKEKGIGNEKIQELIHKRQKYQNNKNVYSLLLQYSAGFGKSNIIGWTALQLKDIRRNGSFVFDKIMLVVDRLQLRDQIDSMLHNMNIQKGMFIEAHDKKTFKKALESNVRIVVVNIQKFGTIKDILDGSIVENLSKLRIAFLIDEIHRSNDGLQNEEMLSIFDELQNSFDKGISDASSISKKNLIVGFTATPSDHTLSRFGEFSHYAENKAIWVPFDYYTMREAIEDGYILNPIKGIVPVSAKMYFEKPENALEGFEGDTGYEEIPDGTDTGVDAEGKKYAIRKKKIYADQERIEAISKFIVERLVSNVYIQIRSTAKAMLATTSIPNAIKYTHFIKKHLKEVTQLKKYERFKDTPVFIVYSDSQEHPSSNSVNDGLNEKTVLQNFKLAKNGIIIVVDKLQTGYDEPKLHTLFLDKEIRGINAIQTISRVNRTTKHKNDCKIVDFSYKNVNVKNIKDAITFLKLVTQKYDVACANPPYTDSANFGPDLKKFVEKNYKKPLAFDTNLYATFIKRCYELTNENGKIAMIHPHTFMFIKTFEGVRNFMIEKTHIDVMVDFGLDRVNLFGPGILLDATFYVLSKGNVDAKGLYFNLTTNLQEKHKKEKFLGSLDDYINNVSNERIYQLEQSKLKIIKSYPFIYWISDEFREKFKDQTIDILSDVGLGLKTANNNKFLRFWWEIEKSNISEELGDEKKWIIYLKGGSFNRWSGNEWLVIDWENNGEKVKSQKNSQMIEKGMDFRSGVTLSTRSVKGVCARSFQANRLFDMAASSIVPHKSSDVTFWLAYANSKLFNYLLNCLNPTVNKQPEDIRRLPAKTDENLKKLSKISFEIKSHLHQFDFLSLIYRKSFLESNISKKSDFKSNFNMFFDYENRLICQILMNEAIINEKIFEVYELSPSDKAMVLEKEGESIGALPVCLEAKNEYLENEIVDFPLDNIRDFIKNLPEKEFTSDEQEQIISEFPTLYQSNNDLEEFCIRHQVNPINVWYWFKESNVIPKQRMNTLAMEFLADMIREILMEDEDGIIPLVPNAGEKILLDRIEEKFIEKGFSQAQYSAFDGVLGRNMNDYINGHFFKALSDHLNLFMYLPKTPFIWHLTSGPEQGFDCYIIIYKWSKDKLMRIRSVYIENRERALINRQSDLANDSSASAQNEKETIFKQLKEIESFKQKIDELLSEGYNPILDDGVGKNIAPLQKKKMLAYDVLNAGQLNTYLNADW